MPISKFHVGEYAQYMTSVDDLVIKYNANELLIDPTYKLFKPALTVLDAAARVEQGNAKSDAVANADSVRDQILNACSMRIDSALICPIADEQASARVLRGVFDKYGDIRALPYNDETGYLSQLLTDLLLPANTPHLQKVCIAGWVVELKKANDLFQKLFADRNAEESAKKAVGNTLAARKVVDGYYNEMVAIVNASVVMKQSKPAAVNFIAEMNTLIKYYKTVLTARSSRNKPSDTNEAKK